MDKRYDAPNQLNWLHDELLAAGITPTLVEGDGTPLGTWVHIVAPQDLAAVDAVVAAHNPHRPPVRTLEERRAAKATFAAERQIASPP